MSVYPAILSMSMARIPCCRAASGPGPLRVSCVQTGVPSPCERLRRSSRRLGGNRAKCAVARSILVIIWHLLSNPEARFAELGPDWHERKADRDRKIRAHVRQLQAIGLDVTITPAA